MAGWHTDLMNMNLSKLWELVMDREACSPWGCRVGHDSVTSLHLSFSISPSNEYLGLISFRIAWFDHLAVQEAHKSLLRHRISKVSIFRCLAFFTVQLSHPYMTTGKTIALARWTLVGKVMSLLLNMLSRLVITFLPRSVF